MFWTAKCWKRRSTIAGWDVVVLEAQPEPGGAVKSAELFPGYVSDLYSAFYPLSVASPALQALHLEDHGLQWTHAPAVVGHPRFAEDADAPVIPTRLTAQLMISSDATAATAIDGVHCSSNG
jgi:phytoene dehydrogenase-like protein